MSLLLAIAFAAFVATPVSAQGDNVAPSRSSLSPAGQAILKAQFGKGHPELTAIIRKRTETRKQIDFQLKADRPDWTVLTALLDRDFVDEMRMRQLSQTIDRALMMKLSGADRIIYLRDRFPAARLPPLLKSPQR